MAHNQFLLALFFISLMITLVQAQNTATKTFTLVNNCKETIWPGIITKGENSRGEGFKLKPGETTFYNASTSWSGRIWARTGCSFDKNGTGSCQTGGCGTSLNCTVPSSPPNTIAEFTLGEVDFYDVSLVDGFNMPIVISPIQKKGNCSTAGCDGDLRQNCPSELAYKSSDGKVIACKSPCQVFDTDEYCCRGAYADPMTCLPSNYSKSFKQVCQAASSYALDDQTSIMSCSASDYIVTFCSSRNQTLCSYHDNKLVCNTSNGANVLRHGWSVVILLALPLLKLPSLDLKF